MGAEGFSRKGTPREKHRWVREGTEGAAALGRIAYLLAVLVAVWRDLLAGQGRVGDWFYRPVSEPSATYGQGGVAELVV